MQKKNKQKQANSSDIKFIFYFNVNSELGYTKEEKKNNSMQHICNKIETLERDSQVLFPFFALKKFEFAIKTKILRKKSTVIQALILS